MDGIVSTFNREFDERVRKLWTQLEERCGLRGVLAAPVPHFSWLIGEQMDPIGIIPPLSMLVADLAAFHVRTSGLGVFTGKDDIVLYIAIVNDAQLFNLQRRISEVALPFLKTPMPYYYPEEWVPHITLGHGDVTPEALGCAVASLSQMDFHWTIPVAGLEIFFQSEGQPAYEQHSFSFGA